MLCPMTYFEVSRQHCYSDKPPLHENHTGRHHLLCMTCRVSFYFEIAEGSAWPSCPYDGGATQWNIVGSQYWFDGHWVQNSRTPLRFPAGLAPVKEAEGPDCETPIKALAPEVANAVITLEEVRTDRFPHKCPACGGPAYVGFAKVECAGGCR